jgi:hypothetical protein
MGRYQALASARQVRSVQEASRARLDRRTSPRYGESSTALGGLTRMAFLLRLSSPILGVGRPYCGLKKPLIMVEDFDVLRMVDYKT